MQFQSGFGYDKYSSKSSKYKYFFQNSLYTLPSFDGDLQIINCSPVASLETIYSSTQSSSSEQHLILGCTSYMIKRSAMVSLSQVRKSLATCDTFLIQIFQCRCMGVLIPSVIIILVNYSFFLQKATNLLILYFIWLRISGC